MKGKRFTEEQIIAVLKEHEAGAPTKDLCWRQGISEQSLPRWKAKFGGMDVSDAKKMCALEDANRKLTPIVAEQVPDIAALKRVLSHVTDCAFALIRLAVSGSRISTKPLRKPASSWRRWSARTRPSEL